jgi:hypothetical protein
MINVGDHHTRGSLSMRSAAPLVNVNGSPLSHSRGICESPARSRQSRRIALPSGRLATST